MYTNILYCREKLKSQKMHHKQIDWKYREPRWKYHWTGINQKENSGKKEIFLNFKNWRFFSYTQKYCIIEIIKKSKTTVKANTWKVSGTKVKISLNRCKQTGKQR